MIEFYKQISTLKKCLFVLINELIHIIHILLNQVVKSYCKPNEQLFCDKSRKNRVCQIGGKML
jgi:hypothetical protein